MKSYFIIISIEKILDENHELILKINTLVSEKNVFYEQIQNKEEIEMAKTNLQNELEKLKNKYDSKQIDFDNKLIQEKLKYEQKSKDFEKLCNHY